MTGSRIAVIPLSQLRAEIVAFPLASEAAFVAGLTKLTSDGAPQLWRAAERELLRASPAVSFDELVAMRDDLWFGENHDGSMHSYVSGIAGRYLERSGPVAVPRLADGSARTALGQTEARTEWRWLTLALPPDLLLAALSAGGPTPGPADTLSPNLAHRLADGGFSEPHLHLSAAFDFGRLWVMTLRGLADARCRPKAFESPGAVFGEGVELGAWLVRAAVVRYMIAAFLFTAHERTDLRGYIDQVCSPDDQLFGRSGGRGHQPGPRPPHAPFRDGAALDGYDGYVLRRVASEVRSGQLTSSGEDGGFAVDYAAARALYKLLINVRLGPGPEGPDELWEWDPIHAFVNPNITSYGTPEVQFVAAALAYIDRAEDDLTFAGLFWQVIRVRCILYRHLVQRPMTPGLQWFVRSFGRLKPARDGIRSALDSRAVLTACTAARLSGAEIGLRSLEVRIAPDSDYSRLYGEVKALNQAMRPQPTPAGNLSRERVGPPWPRTAAVRPGQFEFGIVLHLKRDRGGGWARGNPIPHWAQSEADPTLGDPNRRKPSSSNVTGYRYGRFYREARGTASAAARLLCDCPTSLEVVRGIDLCADEAGVPTWVMKPLLRYIRDAGRHAAASMRQRPKTRPTPALRTTVHAGEDFIHLLSGLRRLDEVLDHLGLVEGDRLGHALALGVEPRRWAQRAGRLAMAKEERLLDLAWEWSWYARGGQGAPGGRIPLIEEEIAHLSEGIFGETLHPRDVVRLVRDLHDEGALRRSGFPDRPPPPRQEAGAPPAPESSDARASRLLFRYLTNPTLFKDGRRITHVDPAGEEDSLIYLQNALREKVGQIGLIIEVNPSSNLLIGHLGDLREHPLWRLAPVVPEEGVPLSVCIGSDDPLTFATTLPEEYQLLYDAMMQNGCSNTTAHSWLEQARIAGLNSRFTLPQSAEAQDPEMFGYVSGDSLSLTLPP